ncbi:MAG TPA: hypothetical protein VLA34_03960, partial [Candidatus Krumholzibacterium sp.]|nr:hypothetical protein [Candidatus Krumholzibacterium sp.]
MRENIFRMIVGAGCLAALLVSGVPAGAQDEIRPETGLGVVYADGRQTEDVDLYRLEEQSEELFISAYDLARIFRATRYWNPGARKLVLRIENDRFMFTLDTRVVVVD